MTRTVISFFILPLFAFLYGIYAHAAPAVIGCHNCTSAQYKTAAENAIPMYFAPGRYDVYVVDRSKPVLKRFRVTAQREPGFTFNHAQSRAPSAAYQQEFDNNVDLLGQLNFHTSEQNGIYVLPGDFEIGSASEVFNNVLAQNAFNEQFNSTFSFQRTVAVIVSILDVFWDVNYMLDVEFPDGSTATYRVFRINASSEDRVEWEYIPGTARDSESNRIPENIGDFANFHGVYGTDEFYDNLQLFIQAAMNFGVPIIDSSSGTIVAVVCSQGAGGTLCEIQTFDSMN